MSDQRIAAFLDQVKQAEAVDFTPEQTEAVVSSIAVLADLDPYLVRAANFQPKELALTFQRVAAIDARIREIQESFNDGGSWFGPNQKFYADSDLKNGFMLYLEGRRAEHAGARESLDRLAQGIVERARMEKGPKV
jgi:hypothetical protein